MKENKANKKKKSPPKNTANSKLKLDPVSSDRFFLKCSCQCWFVRSQVTVSSLPKVKRLDLILKLETLEEYINFDNYFTVIVDDFIFM